MKKPALFLFFLFFAAVSSYGQDEELSALLEEATTIATKSRLNVDYVPGTVTVVKGNDLKAMGVTNLAQLNAFDAVLGMETAVSSLRGVGPWYGANGNKIKWLLNGKTVEMELRTTDQWAKAPAFLPIPVEFVERIEVIRGPGSALYGGNAVFGVVNVVTKKGQNGFFSEAESFGGNDTGVGMGVYGRIKEGDFYADLKVSALKRDGDNLYVDGSGHFYDDKGPTYASGYGPGLLPMQMDGYSIMADLGYGDWEAWIYRFLVRTGQGYDWIPYDSLPSKDSGYCKTGLTTMAGLRYTYPMETFVLVPEVGYSRYENPVDNYFEREEDHPNVKLAEGVEYPYEAARYRRYAEEKIFGQLEMQRREGSHRLLAGAFWQKTRILEDETFYNYDGGTKLVGDYYMYGPLIGEGRERTQKAAFVQDQWEINDGVSLTYGVRYDTFSDVDHAWSPRIAGVWRKDDANILKAQYSRAFRPPTLYEDIGYYSPDRRKPEVADTLEAGYIRKSPMESFKATLFTTVIRDMITLDMHSWYNDNLGNEAVVRGVELEYDVQRDNFSAGAAGAYYHTRNGDSEEPFAIAAPYHGNLFVTLGANSDFPTTLWLNYVSSKPRTEAQTIGEIVFLENGRTPEQYYLNLSQKIRGVFAKGMDLSWGIRNLTGRQVETLYSPLLRLESFGEKVNYDDVPYMGRSYWVNLAQRF